MSFNSNKESKDCYSCEGTGYISCAYCNRGIIDCYDCRGSGVVPVSAESGKKPVFDRCFRCDGSGRISCYDCSGSGTRYCYSCNGSGKRSY